MRIRMRKRSVRKYTVIQVPFDGELLRRVDGAASRVAESRAAYIRDACRERLRREETKDLDRRYVDGYMRKPEDRVWGALGARFLARSLAGDRW
jgi:hypothetical protein